MADAKPVKQVNLTIEGRAVTVPDGTSILEAAKTAGVLIPHYCYHPGLPVAGVCRMCLVEVEKFPKLAPACATAVGEGQVVHVHSEKALEARKGVLEFLLINHPLDCPICDQAGECELQDYTFQEGRAESRYLEPKRWNPAEDFGGDVLYVTNRCILCTRCVRFMDKAAEYPVLNVSERGDRAVIGIHPEQDLGGHAWSGNVIDLCPVGALVSKDFLNKARAWELDHSASVCPNCTQGCNSVLETRDNAVVRMRARPNEDVNQYYLCDQGRLDYRWLNRRDRAELPYVRAAAPAAGRGGQLAPADWEEAVAEAAAVINGSPAHVVASPMLSNEALYLLSRLVGRTGGRGVFAVKTGPEAPLAGVPDLSLRRDRAANVAAAELLGFERREAADVFAGLAAGDVLVVADEELDGVPVRLPAGVRVVVVGTTVPAWAAGADVVLPTANMAEEEGTFTNLRGRVQRFLQAKSPPGLSRASWTVLGDLLAAMGDGQGYWAAADVFDALAGAHAHFAGMSYDTLGLRGQLPAAQGAAAEPATAGAA
jgi:NADH-quinone oxidoreductase subunit G